MILPGSNEGPVRVNLKAFNSIYREKGYVLATRTNTAAVKPDQAAKMVRRPRVLGPDEDNGANEIDPSEVDDNDAGGDADTFERGAGMSAADVAARLGMTEGGPAAGGKAAAAPKPARGRGSASERATGGPKRSNR
jgi:hypothetical protein